MSNSIYSKGKICKKMGEPCIFASEDGTYCTTTGKCDINSRTITFDGKRYKCKKYNTYCQQANSLGLCVLEGGCVIYKALDTPIENPEKFKQEILTKIEDRNHRVEGDKLWETCWLRKILIIVFTFIFASAYLYVANTTNPLLGAIVPCAGFFLSTITIKPIKKYYLLC